MTKKKPHPSPAAPSAPSEPETPPAPPAPEPGAPPAPPAAPAAEAAGTGAPTAPQDEGIEAVSVPAEETEELRKAFASLEHDFLRLKQERDELKDRYLRTLAEMDNLRKRVEREKAEFQSFALNAVLRDILAVVDNFARALAVTPSDQDGKSFQEGMELIHRQLLDFLAKNGVTPIETVGQAFDPTLHQAFESEEGEDVGEPVVSAEMQKGYLLHGRLLRPALVKVRVPKKGG
jgi:molecular chaperone GrpE